MYARGNNGELIYRSDADRSFYLRLLEEVVVFCKWRCLSFCLMPNHIHLLVETRAANLGKGMHALHSRYVPRFNKRYGRGGHLFQGRYGSKRVLTDAYFWTAARYIARNPVEARLCAAPEEYAWGSHAKIASGEPPPWLDVERLLDLFGAFGGDPRTRYYEHVSG